MIRQVYMAMVSVLMVVFAKENVILEVVLYEHQDNGEYNTHTYKLTGRFSRAGTTISAEGDIVQIHPLGLCDATDDDDLYQYGWVGVIKLEEPQSNPEPCLSVYQKAKRAIQRGATAVVFDVTDNPSASHQLHNTKLPSLERPVIIIKGSNALKLMEIVRTKTVARARIVYQKTKTPKPGEDESTTKEYFDMGIFLAFFVLFCVVCIIIIVKLKWSRRRRDTTPSTSDQTKQIVSKLQTRKFKVVASNMSGGWRSPNNSGSRSTISLNSNNCEGCAICLEVYLDGQDLRLIPCGHEFHKACVDPWLLSNHTCPLCMYDILETCKEVSPHATQNARTSQSGNNVIVPVLMPHHSTTISNNYVDFPVTLAQRVQPPNTSLRTTRGQTIVYNEGYRAAAERSSNYANYLDYVSLTGRPSGLLGSGVVSCAHSSGEEYCQIQSAHRTHGTGYRDSNNGHCSDRTRRYRKHYAKTQYADGREHRRTANGRESGQPVQWRTEHRARLSYRNPRLVVMKSYKDFYSPCTSSESDHECVKRSAKVSVAHSHTLEEHTDSNHNQTDISNESIYGSSDTAPSDISSCTSNVYCSSQVDNSKRPDGQTDLPPVRLRPSCTMQRCPSPYCTHARRSTSRPPRRVSCSSCSSLEAWRRLPDDRTDTSRDSVCTVSSGDLSISSVLSCVTEEMDTDKSHTSRWKPCACVRPSEGTRALPSNRQTTRHVCEHSADKMGPAWNATLCTASHRHDQPRPRAASVSCQCSRCDNIALMHERLTQASYNMRLLPWLCPPPPVHPLLLSGYDTHCPANSPGTTRRCSTKDAQCVQCECGQRSISPQLVNTSDNESIQSKRSMVLYSENAGNTQTVPMDRDEEYDPKNVV